jgi:demethylspheroidene O-methyltransferase
MIHGGDVFTDPLPAGADLIALVRILHDHDTPRARRILQSVHAALPPDGQVLIAEPMAGTPGAEPVGDAYFGLYLWAMGGGQPRRPDELGALLRETGFRDIRLIGTRTPLLTRIMLARPTATRSSKTK